jgi:RNA polymerase sigma-70 factor (ECF subfamily)
VADFFNSKELRSVNEQYIEKIYITHYWRAVNYANQFLRDTELAREIAQDAFISLWEKRESLDMGNNIEYYLLSTVRNKVFNHMRSKQRRTNHMGEELPVSDRLNLITLSDYSSERLLCSELSAILKNTLNKMSPNIRETFLLCREEELGYKEIATKLGISIKTVEYRISKALAILREALKDYLPLLLSLILLRDLG